ncbi:MAG TPA: DNA topoisomerase IV subunit A [Euryarchaeota archaeon]|nr:DNA topoisomerase IV subunit A [Euryarchaeota archaeon]
MADDKKYDEPLKALESLAEAIYSQMDAGKIPSMGIPSRTKNNIKFNPKLSVWKYGNAKTVRSAKTLDGAYMLLRTMYMTEFIREMIKKEKSSTLREMYYISEGWNLAKFSSQDESNRLAEDLEIMTMHIREAFKLRPEEDGARVIGNITLRETNRKGIKKRINCRDDVGDSGYGIPFNVELDKVEFLDADVDFIIAIETGGMFDRLVENGFDEEARALLVHLKGQPARSTRRFIKRLNEEKGIPVVIFTDGDPWSFRIFSSIAYGAIKTAYISEYLATPSAMYCGITASDILNYDLPTDKLNAQDIQALKSELTDPRFKDRFWKDEIELMLKINKKAEQQALAKYGLDFVTKTYLPEKLSEIGVLN